MLHTHARILATRGRSYHRSSHRAASDLRMIMTARRDVLLLCPALVTLVFPAGGRADEGGVVGVEIFVGLKEGSEAPPKGSSAIYVTARLAGKIKGFATGRELSPVLSIRIPVCSGLPPTIPRDPHFQTNRVTSDSSRPPDTKADELDLAAPLKVSFAKGDVTPEGAEEGGSWWQGKVTPFSPAPLPPSQVLRNHQSRARLHRAMPVLRTHVSGDIFPLNSPRRTSRSLPGGTRTAMPRRGVPTTWSAG